MLSILPYERGGGATSASSNQQQRVTDRPFKSYLRPQLPPSPPTAHHSHPHHHSTYFNPFSAHPHHHPHSGLIGSLHSAVHHHHHHPGLPLKQDAPMDLRPQSSMYEAAREDYDASAAYVDFSTQMHNRMSNIKSEENGGGGASHLHMYPHINTNPAHSNGYSPALSMHHNMRDMSPTNQAAIPNMVAPGTVSSDSPPGSGMRAGVTSALNSRQHGVFPTPSIVDSAHNTVSGSNRPMPAMSHRADANHAISPHAPATSGGGGGNISPSTSVKSDSNQHSPHDGEEGTSNGLKRPLQIVPDEMKDIAYWEKRKKNNDSAKRSRESRRIKEEQIAMRVVYLEQDNLQLRTEVSLLKSEIEKLRCMLYNS